MPRIAPTNWKMQMEIFQLYGCIYKRKKGSHHILTHPNAKRAVSLRWSAFCQLHPEADRANPDNPACPVKFCYADPIQGISPGLILSKNYATTTQT